MYLRSESGRENISAGGTVVSIKDEINKIQQKPPANQPYRKEGVPHPARRGRNAWAFLTVLNNKKKRLFWHRCGSVPPLFPTPHEKKRLSEYLDLATGFSGRNNTA